MTDRFHALTVVLDRDVRDDDLDALTDAIRMLRGVMDVRRHIADIATHGAEVRVRAEYRRRIYAALGDES